MSGREQDLLSILLDGNEKIRRALEYAMSLEFWSAKTDWMARPETLEDCRIAIDAHLDFCFEGNVCPEPERSYARLMDRRLESCAKRWGEDQDANELLAEFRDEARRAQAATVEAPG